MSDLVLKIMLFFPFVGPSRFGVKDRGEPRNGKGEGGLGDCDSGTIPVTCLQNAAIARKQNLAGVVKEKRMGRTWAASERSVI